MEEVENKIAQNAQKKGKHAKENDNVKKKQKPNLVNNVEKEGKRNKEENSKKENKRLERILTIIIVILALLTFILDIYYIYTKLVPKFKDITIEIGNEKELTIENFITKEKYLEDSKLITDLSQIDLSKVRRI
ncbi:MAG: hypothetical protein HFJ42_05975 [Clostridia bacterium]|nr:hypothetical protein [Clostridia bacterium]